MKTLKFANAAVAALLVALASAEAPAQDQCAVINQILDSGLDRNKPFAAVAGVTLPNADYCEVDFGDSGWNQFECGWNSENWEKLGKLEEEREEVAEDYFDSPIEHSADALTEAIDLDEQGDRMAEEYNGYIRQAQTYGAHTINWQAMADFKARIDRVRRQAQEKRQESDELGREHDELAARYDAKNAEVEKFEKELEGLAEQQAGALYTGIYNCFESGAIHNASAYAVDAEDKSWFADGGCSIYIEGDGGPKFSVYCPNPN